MFILFWLLSLFGWSKASLDERVLKLKIFTSLFLLIIFIRIFLFIKCLFQLYFIIILIILVIIIVSSCCQTYRSSVWLLRISCERHMLSSVTVFLKLWPFSPGNTQQLNLRTQSGWDLFPWSKRCFVRSDLQFKRFLRSLLFISTQHVLKDSVWEEQVEGRRLVCGVFTSKKWSQLILLHLTDLIICLSPPGIVYRWSAHHRAGGDMSFDDDAFLDFFPLFKDPDPKALTQRVWLHSALCDRSMDALHPDSQRLTRVHMCSTDISCFLTWN